MLSEDTFCALATPAGESALAVVRASGPLCEKIACNALGAAQPIKPRRATYGSYCSLDGKRLDEVVWVFFAQNASYTGQAMLEISSHGNPFIVQKILADLVARGCRLAQPGEFTRTAFLNGRIDLSQAEAVGEIIRARTDKALSAAERQLEGALGRRIRTLSDTLLQILAEVEARIDFSDEDLPEGHEEIPRARIQALLEEMRTLACTKDYHGLLAEGARVVIVGAPNAGKSSLLNMLLGEDRALVSAEPGTTRDYIAESWMAGPYRIQLMDTAGIRADAGALESFGIARALEKARSAHAIIFVVDTSQPFPSLPDGMLEGLDPAHTLLVENKIDLPQGIEGKKLEAFPHRIRISLKTGQGTDGLEAALVEVLEAGMTVPDENQILVNARHAAALETAIQALKQALTQWEKHTPAEFVASDLRVALEALGDIVGRADNEALLDKLFATFCIGK